MNYPVLFKKWVYLLLRSPVTDLSYFSNNNMPYVFQMFRLTLTWNFFYVQWLHFQAEPLSNPHAEHDKLFTLHCALGLSYQDSRNRLLTPDCTKQLRSGQFKTYNEIMTEATKTTSAFEVQDPTVKLQTGGIFKRTCGAQYSTLPQKL